MFDRSYKDFTWPNRILASLTLVLISFYVSALGLYYLQSPEVDYTAKSSFNVSPSFSENPDSSDGADFFSGESFGLHLEITARCIAKGLHIPTPGSSRFHKSDSFFLQDFRGSPINSRDPPVRNHS